MLDRPESTEETRRFVVAFPNDVKEAIRAILKKTKGDRRKALKLYKASPVVDRWLKNEVSDAAERDTPFMPRAERWSSDHIIAIGARIRTAREAKGLTQPQLAAALKCTKQLISHWEVAQSAPDIKVIQEIARILRTSAQWIISGTEANGGNGAQPTARSFQPFLGPSDARRQAGREITQRYAGIYANWYLSDGTFVAGVHSSQAKGIAEGIGERSIKDLAERACMLQFHREYGHLDGTFGELVSEPTAKKWRQTAEKRWRDAVLA